ncbi:class 5 chitinase 1 [Grosmannia clavigera kw1407]|uniref:chitinase n=1 Tax=Grosmannia clavigera (strain kw1407 / UAMH 11150) TaxID=655863 RepID=F0XAS6_GROCL|nr:class 5 chitinase 1 [Grosmannia clavigera kw1407]EFX05487.1 class 5 chitinase 1 [Grosmannia clavigera kw1407]
MKPFCSLVALAGLASLGVALVPQPFNAKIEDTGPWAVNLDISSHSFLKARSLPTGTCNAETPYENDACCGSDNLCGYSPKSCSTGCQHNCECLYTVSCYIHLLTMSPGDAKAECGPYAAEGEQKCPLNVCCSEFGFCGSTSEFCTWNNTADPNYSKCDTAYGGCGSVDKPSCSSGGNGASKRNIGYYESWANTRTCQNVAPEDLNLDGFTSINFAFAFFDPASFTITSMDSNAASLCSRFTALKDKKPGLKTYISVGGWSFTDPGATQKAFSNMASSSGNREKFINGLVNFMDTFGFDGVDLDWEYPGADDRGGVESDTANYVALVEQMRQAFGTKYGLTVTIPTSYWYLQHFDVESMQTHIDWFNLMAYDLHGTWDAQSKYVGPYIAPHTNIIEIDAALDLLWRAGVDSKNVVLGQGWYGRSFTLKDSSCSTPNGMCEFKGGADPGPCSKAAGILDCEGIADIVSKNNLDPWVSYDDKDTFKQKRDFANKRCLGGLMVWAMDQVDQTAENGFGGAAAAAGAAVSLSQQKDANSKSSDMLAGLKCYVSDCTSSCKAGTVQVAQFNGQPGQISTSQRCSKKKYRSLCCDSSTTMGTCQWRGYRGAGLSCIKGCADGETELTTNTNEHESKKGDKNCHGGLQSFCCSGYKPTSSSLEDDLKDAAKAAAEAAAEQAALDLAAKAFCRVAVPALLAPLELLEDLIPIIGEIADAIEIAATPGIIEGCVKGIEKEGKAEFKVFGKKHTLSINSPTTKATTVPSRDDPKGDNPSKTGDKNGKCTCVAKRAPAVPTETTFKNSERMGFLCYVHWNSPEKTTVKECGEVVREKHVTTRDWWSNGYDLYYENVDGKKIIHAGGPELLIRDGEGKVTKNTNIGSIGSRGMTWTGDTTFDKSYAVWQDMGPIRDGIKYSEAKKAAEVYAQKYEEYGYFTNNCYQYANNLYYWMVDGIER